MKQINICHFADHLNGKQDGVFNHIISILQNTDKTRFKHYLCFQGDKYIEQEFQNYGGEVIIIPSLSKKIPLNVFYYFYQNIKSHKIDIIQSHFLKPYAIGGICNILLKKKMLFNYHGFFINNLFNSLLEQQIYRIAHLLITLTGSVDLAIVPSVNSRKLLLADTKLFKVVKQYYNSNLQCGTAYDNQILNAITNDQSFKIAFIGRIEKEKNLEFAIRLINKFPERKVKLFVFGSGSHLAKVQKLVSSLQLDAKIKFFGFVENARNYLKFMDLLLITSHSEGLPFVLWEAMACSVPVLASDVGGISEILNNEQCGLVFKKNDIEDAAKKLNLLFSNPELKAEMGIKGQFSVNQKYTPRNFGKTIEKIYLELMGVN